MRSLKSVTRLSSLLLLTLFLPLFLSAQQVEQIYLTPDDHDSVSAERWELSLPEVRSNPDSRTVPLVFLRFESYADQPGDPVIYLAGGPGGSGIDAAEGRRWELFEKLREHSDLIILDQRGTGQSNIIPECVASTMLPDNRPLNKAEYVSLHRKGLEECLSFWKSGGVQIEGYTTRESAADIEAVRTALEVDQVNLLGISYGTHLALATMKYYPESVNRAVLASAEGLDETVKLPAHTRSYFKRLQAAINQDPEARKVYPDLLAMIDSAQTRISVNPPLIKVPEGRNNPQFDRYLSLFEAQLYTGYLIGDPRNTTWLLAAYRAANRGDWTWFRRFMDWMSGSNQIDFDGMPVAMDIASGISDERLKKVQNQAPESPVGDALNFVMPHLRYAIPGITLPDEFREPLASDHPILLLSGTLDGRTYMEAHQAMHERLTNSTLVTVKYGGHNIFFTHPDIPDMVAAYLSGESIEDQTIEAELPSFLLKSD